MCYYKLKINMTMVFCYWKINSHQQLINIKYGKIVTIYNTSNYNLLVYKLI